MFFCARSASSNYCLFVCFSNHLGLLLSMDLDTTRSTIHPRKENKQMDGRHSPELGSVCEVAAPTSQTPLRASKLCCTLIRNPEPWNKGNDFVFQFNLFSFFDGVKVHLPSLNLKANYSCVIFILMCPG